MGHGGVDEEGCIPSEQHGRMERLPEPSHDLPAGWRDAVRAEFDEYAAVAADPFWRLPLNLIPQVGGFIAEFHAQWAARRLDRERVLVEEMTATSGISAEELSEVLESDLMLRSCMEVALDGAARAVTDAQLQLLRRVMRRAIDSEVRADVAYYQLATIRELTPAHLDVLRIVDRRQEVDPPSLREREAQTEEYRRYHDGGDHERCTTDASDILAEYPGVEPILDSVMAGLVRLGLIEHTRNHGFEEATEKHVRTGFAFHLLETLREDPQA
jgi:hypothetical protein